MWTNIDDTTMESSILCHLADFNISAPIKVTVSFDTDSDETRDILIKTENETDNDIVGNTDVANFVGVSDLKPKQKEIKEEPLILNEETEQINNNEETAHNILKKITTHQVEEIQNNLFNDDNSRKRKQQQLQIFKNKKAAKMTDQKKSDDRAEKSNENEGQEKVSAFTIESSPLVYNQGPETSPLNQPHLRTTVLPNPSIVPPQPDVPVQSKDEAKKNLIDLADHLRHIMEAYFFQREKNTSKENFKRLKDRYFNLSYDTVVKLILPMENNKEFIHGFLIDTHRLAAGKSHYICGYQDYGILLNELMTWARNISNIIKQKLKNTVQPTEIIENVKNLRELKELQLGNNNKNFDDGNKSAQVNSLCIFSSGSPGREISINIDPSINRYVKPSIVNETNKDARNIQPPPVSIERQKQSQNPCNSVNSARTNNKQNVNKKQPASSPPANMLRMDYQRSQQQSQHESPQSLSHSTNLPVQYRQSPSLPPKYGQTINLQPQHGQSQSVQQQYRQPEAALPLLEQQLNVLLQVQSQYGKQQYMQRQNKHFVHPAPQYTQSQNRQQQVVQFPLSLHQYVQSQPVLPHHEQAHSIQQQLSQTHSPNYNQYHNVLVQPQAQLNYMFPHGGQMRTAPPPYPHYVLQQHIQPRNSPIQVGLTKPVHPSYEQPQHALPQNQQSKPAKSQAGQLQQHSPIQVGLTKPVHTFYEQPQHAPPQNQQSKPASSQAGQLQQHSPIQIGLTKPVHPFYKQPQHAPPQNQQSKPASSQAGPLQQHSPIQVGLTKPVHPFYEQPQHAPPQNQQSKPASSQAGQLQQQTNQLNELLDSLDWHQELTAIYKQPNMQQQIQKNAPRSASTDSGFISPLNFNVSADQTVPPPSDTETSPLLITHVTSLNPKVSFIDEGECVICKKRTKQMCMGCMKYYYCSYDCQVKDWRSHQANCSSK